MKVAIVNEYFSPIVTGGIELFLKAFSDYLKEQGFEIVVFTSKQNIPNDAFPFPTHLIKSNPFKIPYHHGVPGISYYQLPGITTPWMCFNRGLQKELASLYRKEKPDVIFVNALPHLSYAPLQAADNIPVVTFVHDYFPICFIRDFSYCNKEPYLNRSILRCAYCLGSKLSPPRYSPYLAPFVAMLLLPSIFIERHAREKAMRHSGTFICDSNFVAKVLGNHGYQAEVIPTPYLGRIENFEREDSPGNPKQTYNILFLGRMEWRKGSELLLEVAKQLQNKIDFRIDVVGAGYKAPMLDRKDLNIYLQGYLQEERFNFLRNADCLIVPSIWPEPLGMVAQEAMAYQVPVVALKQSGGLAELVLENGAGLLAENEHEIADCILQLYHNPELVREIRQRGPRNITKYDKYRTFEKLRGILLKAVQSKNK